MRKNLSDIFKMSQCKQTMACRLSVSEPCLNFEHALSGQTGTATHRGNSDLHILVHKFMEALSFIRLSHTSGSMQSSWSEQSYMMKQGASKRTRLRPLQTRWSLRQVCSFCLPLCTAMPPAQVLGTSDLGWGAGIFRSACRNLMRTWSVFG